MYSLTSKFLYRTYSTRIKHFIFRPSHIIIITPRSLKSLLKEIENHLPQFLQPPYDPSEEIWKIYQTLACTTVLDKGQCLVIISIPLLDMFNKFENFDIFSMPEPIKNPRGT